MQNFRKIAMNQILTDPDLKRGSWSDLFLLKFYKILKVQRKLTRQCFNIWFLKKYNATLSVFTL